MKKLLLAFALLVAVQVSAMAQTYSFSQSSGAYADLTGATDLFGSAIWDDTSKTVTIGFPVTLGGVAYSSVEVNSNGVLIFDSGTNFAAVVAYDADMMSLGTATSTSPVSYSVTGTTGSRILKVQWKNAGFYDGTANDFVNVQAWIYEGSNKIETHFGTSNIGNPGNIFGSAGGPANGVATSIDFFTETITGLFVQGNPASATAVPLTASANYPSLSGTPANGAIYTYTVTGGMGVAEALNQVNVSVYPNPVMDELRIAGFEGAKNNVTVNVYDVLGKVVLTQQVKAAAIMPVNVSKLTKGTYFLEIVSGNNRAGKQLIKQ